MGLSFFGQYEWNSAIKFNPCFKKKYLWKFKIEDISGEGVNALPPKKSARPTLTFKEMSAEHLNETIWFPSKPEWKPITLELYDIRKQNHRMESTENPIFTWIKRVYDPSPIVTASTCLDEPGPVPGAGCSSWFPALADPITGKPSIKAIARLELYDGCENIMESWIYEHVYPQNADFGELEMNSSDVCTCTVSLRYDRAYILYPNCEPTINFPTTIEACENPISFTNFQPVAMPEFRAVF